MLSMGEKKYLSVACVVPIDRFNVFDVQPTGKPDTDFDDFRRTVDLMCVLGALVPALVIHFCPFSVLLRDADLRGPLKGHQDLHLPIIVAETYAAFHGDVLASKQYHHAFEDRKRFCMPSRKRLRPCQTDQYHKASLTI